MIEHRQQSEAATLACVGLSLHRWSPCAPNPHSAPTPFPPPTLPAPSAAGPTWFENALLCTPNHPFTPPPPPAGGPTWFEFAFGCVRSRSFKLGPDAFALVPFMDAANHAAEPSVDFRVTPESRAVELVAVRPGRVGEEATVSYTGLEG